MVAVDAKRQEALAAIISSMGKEELKLVEEYMAMLEETDDEDAQYVFKKLISESTDHLMLDTKMLIRLSPEPQRWKKAPHEELKKLLKDLERAEKREKEALAMYEKALPKLDDPDLKGTVMFIRDQEITHVKLVQRLKELTKKKLGKM